MNDAAPVPGSAAPAVVLRLDRAILVPPLPRGRWGKILPLAIFDKRGRPQPLGVTRTERRSSQGWLPPGGVPQNLKILRGRWLYGGLISDHFGHQLTRSLGRLAALGTGELPDGILYVAPTPESCSPQAVGLLAQTLDGLGVRLPIRRIPRPIKVRELWLGPDLFGEGTDGLADPAFVRWARQAMLPADARPIAGRRLYVTRGRLDPTMGRLLCEEILEENLMAHGYEVFAPETVPLAEQIRTYMSAERIVASDGSAVHVMAFARQPGQQIAIVGRRATTPVLLANHLASFGHGLTDSAVSFVNALVREWKPEERGANVGWGEVDFSAIRARLADAGFIGAAGPWRVPQAQDVAQSLLRGLPAGARRDSSDGRSIVAPAHGG